MKKIVSLIVWFGCGYLGAALFTGHFYGKYGQYGIETKGSAARASLPIFVTGPVGAFLGFALGDDPPMWDWPKYLLDYKPNNR